MSGRHSAITGIVAGILLAAQAAGAHAADTSIKFSLDFKFEGPSAPFLAPDGAYAQWPIFVQANGIDASKVTIENVGFPVREPMLAAGQVDAITGFSFSSFINLKDKGVPVDDITVLLMADYGVNLYGNV